MCNVIFAIINKYGIQFGIFLKILIYKYNKPQFLHRLFFLREFNSYIPTH